MIYVLEIFSQPIPNGMQEDAAKYLSNMLYTENDFLYNKPFEKIECICTYRKLAFKLTLKSLILTMYSSVKGPKITANSLAITSFKNKYQTQEFIEQNGYYYTKEKIVKLDIIQYLQELSYKILNTFSWPQSMQWMSDSDFRWIRPIYNILAMLDDQIIDINIGHIYSNNLIFDDKLNSVILKNTAEYNACDTRLESVLKQLEKYICIDDITAKDMRKIKGLACAAESPYLVVIKVDFKLPEIYANAVFDDYLVIKDQVFTVSTTSIVSVRACTDLINSKLNDMQKLFDQDVNADKGLWQEKAGKIAFMNGTILDKIRRIYQVYPEENVLWFKADLASKVVQEYPLLAMYHMQFIQQKLDIIRDHWLILLDNLDSLVQLFLQNVPVNSSQDPYGLKKLAQICIENGVKMMLKIDQNRSKMIQNESKTCKNRSKMIQNESKIDQNCSNFDSKLMTNLCEENVQVLKIDSGQDDQNLCEENVQVLKIDLERLTIESDLYDLICALNGEKIAERLVQFLTNRMEKYTGCIFDSGSFWSMPIRAKNWVEMQLIDREEILKAKKRVVNLIKSWFDSESQIGRGLKGDGICREDESSSEVKGDGMCRRDGLSGEVKGDGVCRRDEMCKRYGLSSEVSDRLNGEVKGRVKGDGMCRGDESSSEVKGDGVCRRDGLSGEMSDRLNGEVKGNGMCRGDGLNEDKDVMTDETLQDIVCMIDVENTLCNLLNVSKRLNEFFDQNLVLNGANVQSRVGFLQMIYCRYVLLTPDVV